MAFLASPTGRWTVRALALPVIWAILAFGFEIDWYAGGEPLLIGFFAVMLACGVYAIDQTVALMIDLADMRLPQRAARLQWQGPVPPLSTARQTKVRRLHKVMAEAGVFVPEVPDPALAFAAFAVDRQPVDWMGVLQSLAEAPYYHPQLNEATWAASWSANLLYDHVPAAWLTPPEGMVAAVLWEDETIFISLVKADSMVALAQQIGRSASWSELSGEVLEQLATAGVPVR